MNGFISCDWGTSSFRLRFVSLPVVKVVAEEISGDGIAATYNSWQQSNKKQEERFDFYRSILKEKIKALEQKLQTALENLPVVISGMASSSIGMMEMPYKQIPFNLDGSDLLTKKVNSTPDFPHNIFIISGVRTENDVMRGEETQLIGSAVSSNKEQLFIFPGTHSKHVFSKEGKAIDFKTYMTGEFFELLSKKSILTSSVEKTGALSREAIDAFMKGVEEAGKSNLLHASFLTRTNQLFDKFSKQENYYYLSGVLIGSELKEVKIAKHADVFLVGAEELCFFYLKALEILQPGKEVKTINADEATIKGQYKIYSAITYAISG